MIAPRAERRGLRAARPVLVVGMAPSRAGHDLDGPTFDRLAAYAGWRHATEMAATVDFVNLLPEWPGEAGSPKWDAAPDRRDWAVGQRVALLKADLQERPRRMVVGLGGFVRSALTEWMGLPPVRWLEVLRGTGASTPDFAFSPHPAGTNMWWNDPMSRAAGEGFWHAVHAAAYDQPRAPRKVPVIERSRWLVETTARFVADGWPEACVDWPYVDPAGRPQALSRGASRPASHIVLELMGQPRPSPEHQALHSCDRGEDCVSGGHLRWGTELENRMDMVDRGRGSIGKIGLDEAREIVKEFDFLVGAMAKARGVTRDAILGIALGKSWDPAKWTRRL